MNWSVYPSFIAIILVQIYNFFAKTSQAEPLLFMSGFNYFLQLIFWVLLTHIPRAKQHTVKVSSFIATVSPGIIINLALRSMLPVKVDMTNLAVF